MTPRAAAGADHRARRSQGEARRQRILDVAIEMFAAHGFRGTRIAEVADRVGMTHPGLLYYFGTKERLLEDVVATREAGERAGYLASLGDGASTFGLAEVARFARDGAVLTRLYHVLAAENLDPGEPLHEFFVARYAHARRFASRALEHDRARGDVRADVDLAQVATEIVATLLGLEAQWLMDPDAVDLVAAVEGYVDGLRSRLAPPRLGPRRPASARPGEQDTP